MERMMRVQDVLLKAMAKKITWWAAAKILATMEEMLRLYREEYYDLNMRHFHEKLRDEHAIRMSYCRFRARSKAPAWWRNGTRVGHTGGDDRW